MGYRLDARFATRKAQSGQDRLPFTLYVRNDNRRPRLVKLIAACGALGMDDPAAQTRARGMAFVLLSSVALAFTLPRPFRHTERSE